MMLIRDTSMLITGDYNIHLPVMMSAGPVKNYLTPPDNPFYGLQGYRDEIWALGLHYSKNYSIRHAASPVLAKMKMVNCI
jgi:hypothetical protein